MPALARRYPKAWFLKMEAHFGILCIDSRPERYHIAAALLSRELHCNLLENGEWPYDDVHAFIMARRPESCLPQ